MRRRRLQWSLPVAGLLACFIAATPATAVTGGAPDPGHPYAVAIISTSTGRPVCSGVWTDIGQSRHVVVTDAHCVPRSRAARARVYFGRSWTSGAHTWSGRSFRHPSYDASTHRNDVAVILLDADPRVTPAVLSRPGAATTTGHVAVVGYGNPHSGQRWSATEMVSSWSSWRLYLHPGTGNTCGGDSGAPDMLPGTRQVLALTDEGSCSWDEDTRVDRGSARDFILGPH